MSESNPNSAYKRKEPGIVPVSTRLKNLPWWALFLLFLGVLLVYAIINRENYRDAFEFIAPGLQVTLTASVIAFAIALVVGLIMGMGRISSNPITYNIATFYVEVVRGIPMIVIIIYVAFVLVPLVVQGANHRQEAFTISGA